MELLELKNMSRKELETELQKARKELLKYTIGVKTGHEKGIHLLRKAKKHVAHTRMVMQEKRL